MVSQEVAYQQQEDVEEVYTKISPEKDVYKKLTVIYKSLKQRGQGIRHSILSLKEMARTRSFMTLFY